LRNGKGTSYRSDEEGGTILGWGMFFVIGSFVSKLTRRKIGRAKKANS
jgi:hypothetical protein